MYEQKIIKVSYLNSYTEMNNTIEFSVPKHYVQGQCTHCFINELGKKRSLKNPWGYYKKYIKNIRYYGI